jgi:N-acetylmuramoyl-L-alanine amidase
MRGLRCAWRAIGLGCVAALCCAAGARAAAGDTSAGARISSRKAQKKIALTPWEQAERGREELEAIPDATRTAADYTRAMDGYRAIYHERPGDLHAPAAVNAVAELLAEQGRGLRDLKSSKAAVGQYEFLRTQYPGSSLRVQALLAEGQIEENDLNDAAAARERYKLLLKDYPRSEQAEEARAGLDSLGQVSVVRSPLSGASARDRGISVGETTYRDTTAMNGAPAVVAAEARVSQTQVMPHPTRRDETAMSGAPEVVAGPSGLPATATTGGNAEAMRTGVSAPPVDMDQRAVDAGTSDANGAVRGSMQGSMVNTTAKKGGQRALVTGIRHWSTATYTRVAIDLGDNVTYEAARVPNPDRIYFDLHGTRLAPELVGKSFAVTDDGFLKRIRAAQSGDNTTRVVLDVNDVTEYSAFLLPNPYRLIIDIHGAKSGPAPVTMGAVQRRADPAPTVPNTTAVGQTSSADVAAVSEVPGRVQATTRPTSKPISAVVSGAKPADADDVQTTIGAAEPTHRDTAAMNAAPGSVSVAADGAKKKTKKVKGKASSPALTADATPARAAVPTADGETSLVRALGLKIGRIVIDAGHGGHDSGTLGADGIEEKDVVLDVALRLGALLHDKLGAEIIYTRSDDTFVPLETRTAIANKARADLFLSIHANSSPDASARGVETYYLNFTSDPTALEVAARENAVSDQSIHQLSDLVKKIALKDKIAESREFASDVEGSLYAGLEKGNAGLKDRGVKQAPFVVLIGANMPSILAEISFVTNPKDADQLLDPDYRERVAESLYRGVARYEAGLSGTRETTIERASAGR